MMRGIQNFQLIQEGIISFTLLIEVTEVKISFQKEGFSSDRACDWERGALLFMMNCPSFPVYIGLILCDQTKVWPYKNGLHRYFTGCHARSCDEKGGNILCPIKEKNVRFDSRFLFPTNSVLTLIARKMCESVLQIR